MTLALACSVPAADAYQPGLAGYGLATPFLVGYGTSTATIPYFARHPPVYYGARQYRSYGTSPYAVPPGWPGVTSYSAGRGQVGRPVGNPFVCTGGCSPLATGSRAAQREAEPPVGLVQTNPFTLDAETLAIW